MSSGRLQMPDADMPTPRDHATIDCFYIAQETVSLDRQYETFTPKQGYHLRIAADIIQAMLLRVDHERH